MRFRLVYGNNGGDGGGGDGGGGGGGGGNGGGGNSNTNKAFSQEDVNRLLAEEKRKHTKVLEDLKNRSGATEAEKAELEKRISQLQQEYMTKEEKAQQEYLARHTALEASNKELTSERDSWKTRFADTSFVSATVSAAAKHDAYDPDMIATILRPNMQLVEVLDASGKGTGQYTTKVKIEKTQDGKTVSLLASPQEAVEMMAKEEKHAYLFKSTKKGGGGTSSEKGAANRSGELDPNLASTNPAAFRAAAKERFFPKGK